MREKYREYGIADEPFVIVKADAGTYGMGIMTVKSPDDVTGLNRKQRNKMAVVKEGLQVHEVIIQEGVPTYERVDGGVAEPVVYMIDRYVVGGFYRVHRERGIDENLNAPGMHFVPLAMENTPFSGSCNLPDCKAAPGSSSPTASTPMAWSRASRCWLPRSSWSAPPARSLPSGSPSRSPRLRPWWRQAEAGAACRRDSRSCSSSTRSTRSRPTRIRAWR